MYTLNNIYNKKITSLKNPQYHIQLSGLNKICFVSIKDATS